MSKFQIGDTVVISNPRGSYLSDMGVKIGQLATISAVYDNNPYDYEIEVKDTDDPYPFHAVYAEEIVALEDGD